MPSSVFHFSLVYLQPLWMPRCHRLGYPDALDPFFGQDHPSMETSHRWALMMSRALPSSSQAPRYPSQPFTLGRVNREQIGNEKKRKKEAPTGLSIHRAGTGSVRW